MKKDLSLKIGALCIATYLLGIFCIPLMDIDATQYASISREMLVNGNYLKLYDMGADYLDKPPMLFWLSSQSLRLFGMYDWAYRLPSFLFSLLSVYSTYRLALLFYKKEIAVLSVVVLASCQAMFLMNHDVRTDTMLMGWVTASIWQLAEWYQFKKWKNLVLAAIAIAGGMMTKGPLALMIPAFAFGPHFLLRRQWKEILRWQYLPMLIIIAMLLIPMSIGLYQQFDATPGKIASGKIVDSGLRFFYWTQSFGRITGENTLRENGSIFFQLQNMLWSFLPWIIFFIAGIFTTVAAVVRKRFLLTNKDEFITAGGFILTYLAIGSSKVQLPHYIFVVFPLAAIITANFLYRLFYNNEFSKLKKPLYIFHAVVFLLLWLALMALIWIPFSTIPIFVSILAASCFIAFLWLLFAKNLRVPNIIAICLFTSIGLNIFLNTAFYPTLLTYQTGNVAASVINQLQLPKKDVYVYKGVIAARQSFYFYGNYFFKQLNNAAEVKEGNYLLISGDDQLALAKEKNMSILFTGTSFPVTRLSFKFINPATRQKEISIYHIVKIL